MYWGVARDINWPKIILDAVEHISLRATQRLGHIGIRTQYDLLALVVVRTGDSPGLFQNFIRNGLRRLDQAGSLANSTRRAKSPLQRLLHAFARHDHQTEVIERKH